MFMRGFHAPLYFFLERIIMRTDYTKASKKTAEINDNIDTDKIIEKAASEIKLEKQKLFISLPMNGRSEDDILSELEFIGNKFKAYYDIIDSYHQEDDPNGIDKYSGVWYLGRSIQLMRTANLVVFAKTWTSARGCIIEHRVCELYDIPYIEMI